MASCFIFVVVEYLFYTILFLDLYLPMYLVVILLVRVRVQHEICIFCTKMIHQEYVESGTYLFADDTKILRIMT